LGAAKKGERILGEMERRDAAAVLNQHERRREGCQPKSAMRV